GTFASAARNSALLEGSGEGAGGWPKLGGVVPGTPGNEPRLTDVPSVTALTPGLGASRLPAMSVASARNSYVLPGSPSNTNDPLASGSMRCQLRKSPPVSAT